MSVVCTHDVSSIVTEVLVDARKRRPPARFRAFTIQATCCEGKVTADSSTRSTRSRARVGIAILRPKRKTGTGSAFWRASSYALPRLRPSRAAATSTLTVSFVILRHELVSDITDGDTSSLLGR